MGVGVCKVFIRMHRTVCAGKESLNRVNRRCFCCGHAREGSSHQRTGQKEIQVNILNTLTVNNKDGSVTVVDFELLLLQ